MHHKKHTATTSDFSHGSNNTRTRKRRLIDGFFVLKISTSSYWIAGHHLFAYNQSKGSAPHERWALLSSANCITANNWNIHGYGARTQMLASPQTIFMFQRKKVHVLSPTFIRLSTSVDHLYHWKYMNTLCDIMHLDCTMHVPPMHILQSEAPSSSPLIHMKKAMDSLIEWQEKTFIFWQKHPK